MSEIDSEPRTLLHTSEAGDAAAGILPWVSGAPAEPAARQSPGPGGRPVSAGHPQTLAVRIAHRRRMRLLRAERLSRLAGQAGTQTHTPPAGPEDLGDVVAAALAATRRDGCRDWPKTAAPRPAARRAQSRAMPGARSVSGSWTGGTGQAANAQDCADNSAALAELLQVLADRIGPIRDFLEPPARSAAPGLAVCVPSGFREVAAENAGQAGGVLAFHAAGAPVADGLETLPGAGPGLIRALRRAGVTRLETLARAEAGPLAARLGPAGQLVDLKAWIDFARRRSVAPPPGPGHSRG